MKKSTKYGIIGSALSCVIVLLLLLYIFIPMLHTPEKEDEGLIVSFGDKLEGSGMTETPTTTPTKTATPVTPIKTVKPVKQDFMTQTDNSLVVAEQKRKKEERQEQVALERQRLETEQRLADQRRKEQDAIDKANAMNGMFGNNNSTGSGTSTGDSQQGNPVGKGSSGGNSWSLNGRSLTGRLVSPSYNRDVEGKVTVNIRVDQNGNVISANIGSPTTISDKETRNAATSAAKNTRFTSGKGVSAGSITYNFRLK